MSAPFVVKLMLTVSGSRFIYLACMTAIAAPLALLSLSDANAETKSLLKNGNWTAGIEDKVFFGVVGKSVPAFGSSQKSREVSFYVSTKDSRFRILIDREQLASPRGSTLPVEIAFNSGTIFRFNATCLIGQFRIELTSENVTTFTHELSASASMKITLPTMGGEAWTYDLAGTSPAINAMYKAVREANLVGLPQPWSGEADRSSSQSAATNSLPVESTKSSAQTSAPVMVLSSPPPSAPLPPNNVILSIPTSVPNLKLAYADERALSKRLDGSAKPLRPALVCHYVGSEIVPSVVQTFPGFGFMISKDVTVAMEQAPDYLKRLNSAQLEPTKNVAAAFAGAILGALNERDIEIAGIEDIRFLSNIPSKCDIVSKFDDGFSLRLTANFELLPDVDGAKLRDAASANLAKINENQDKQKRLDNQFRSGAGEGMAAYILQDAAKKVCVIGEEKQQLTVEEWRKDIPLKFVSLEKIAEPDADRMYSHIKSKQCTILFADAQALSPILQALKRDRVNVEILAAVDPSEFQDYATRATVKADRLRAEAEAKRKAEAAAQAKVAAEKAETERRKHACEVDPECSKRVAAEREEKLRSERAAREAVRAERYAILTCSVGEMRFNVSVCINSESGRPGGGLKVRSGVNIRSYSSYEVAVELGSPEVRIPLSSSYAIVAQAGGRAPMKLGLEIKNGLGQTVLTDEATGYGIARASE